MSNLSKEKILISLVIITLITLVICNVRTFATEEVNNTNTSRAVITATPVNNTENNANTANTNSNTNSNTNNTNTNTNTNTRNTNSSNTANNVLNNTNSSRNSSSYVNSSSLPYAGTSSSIIFIVIALGISAIYAYKKVKEYGE